jgi:hypothetical protein
MVTIAPVEPFLSRPDELGQAIDALIRTGNPRPAGVADAHQAGVASGLRAG